MVPRLLAAARAMRSRTCADVIQPYSVYVKAISNSGLYASSILDLDLTKHEFS